MLKICFVSSHESMSFPSPSEMLTSTCPFNHVSSCQAIWTKETLELLSLQSYLHLSIKKKKKNQLRYLNAEVWFLLPNFYRGAMLWRGWFCWCFSDTEQKASFLFLTFLPRESLVLIMVLLCYPWQQVLWDYSFLNFYLFIFSED